MFGLDGIKKLNDSWITKQAEYKKNRELARRQVEQQGLIAKVPQAHQVPVPAPLVAE